MLILIATASVVLKMVGDMSLVWALAKGYTKQHRVTWLIFTLTAVVFLRSQMEMGMGLDKWFFVWILCVNMVVLALMFVRGRGRGGMTTYDRVAFALALISLALLYVVSDRPIVALLCTIAADLIGAWLGIREAWRRPWEQLAWPWAFGTCGSFLGIFATGTWDWML